MQIKKEIKAYEERVEKYLIKNNLQIKIHWKCKIYSCLLSNFVDNLAEDINKNKCENSIENCLEYTEEICKTNTKIRCYLEYERINVKRLQHKCLKCNKNYEKNLNNT